MIERKDCNHEILTFGSGAYFIVCTDCYMFWQQEEHFNIEGAMGPILNNSLRYGDDIRTKPVASDLEDFIKSQIQMPMLPDLAERISPEACSCDELGNILDMEF